MALARGGTLCRAPGAVCVFLFLGSMGIALFRLNPLGQAAPPPAEPGGAAA